MIDIYAWEDTAETPVDNVYVPVRVSVGPGSEANTKADTASPLLDAMPAGKKSLLLLQTDSITRFYRIDGSTPADLINMITTEPDDADAVLFCNDFFARLVSNGSDVDHIWMDFEAADMEVNDMWTAAGSGTQLETNIQAVLDDPTANAVLPHWLSSTITATNFAPVDGQEPDQKAWNQWANWQKGYAYRRVVVEAAESALGHKVLASNFNDLVQSNSFRGVNAGGRDLGTMGAGGLVSSPQIYMADTDPSNIYSGLTLENRWNNFIRHINQMKAAVAAGSRLIPWIGMPNYNSASASDPASFSKPTYLWEEIIKHAYVLDPSIIFLWFNQSDPVANPSEMEPLALRSIRALEDIKVPGSFPLTETAYDSTSVTTGPITTPYVSGQIT